MPRNTIKALSPSQLFTACDPSKFGFKDTSELEDIEVAIGQRRAVDALRFAMRVSGEGYNVFALGPPGLGKRTAVREVLEQEARKRPVPSDWVYVNNFEDAQRPRALRLPAGYAVQLRRDMEQFSEELASAIPAAFESEPYQARVHELEEEFKERQANALNELREEARRERIALINTPAGFAFAPMDEHEETLRHDEFEKLPPEEQARLEEAVRRMQERLQKVLRQFPLWGKETREKLKSLNREFAQFAVNHLIEGLKTRYREFPEVLEYLDEVQSDVVARVEEFRAAEGGAAAGQGPFRRYVVNVMVDNSGREAAPVVFQDLPTHPNLCGRLEHQAHMGTLVTDFTLIRPGDFHRATGGYLVLDARKVLQQPFAWESLKRTLKAREVRIETLEHMLSLMSTVSLEPQPIPLDIKVVLVGEPLLFYLLSEYDPDFQDLFRVASDFEHSVARKEDVDLAYARLFATLARRESLRPLDATAVARLIEQCARIAEDAERLTAHLGDMSELLREADYWASVRDSAVVAREDVQRAADERVHRNDRVRERVYEEIRRGTLLIDTAGSAVGQVNGLSVLDLGNFAFGRPARITASVRLGEGNVLDIERETELGGPLHSKGVLILSGFLGARYAPGRPLSVNASLVFEQSYGMVEGDSASLAELCALLSALADVPVRQSLAVTGSVNQHGQVQPIGGVNEKVEGFFDVCRAEGLSGEQGVLIPAANVRHLMLRADLVDAARNGEFQVFAVSCVDQAMELLTGLAAGARGRRGAFPKASLNARVEARLLELSVLREQFGKGAASGDGGGDG